MLPVFGGISGLIRTTLNMRHFLFRFVLFLLQPQSVKSSEKLEEGNGVYSLLATNFSSFTTSTANLRMPSACFLCRHRVLV